jgi:hypothetical protein
VKQKYHKGDKKAKGWNRVSILKKAPAGCFKHDIVMLQLHPTNEQQKVYYMTVKEALALADCLISEVTKKAMDGECEWE